MAAVPIKSVELAILIKEIQIDVIKVELWIKDISATRALPGLDDGLSEAALYADKFHEDVAKAREMALSMGLNNLVEVLDQTEAVFASFYQVGKRMAETYVAKGPGAGNKVMFEFDNVAVAMGEHIDYLMSEGATAIGVSLKS